MYYFYLPSGLRKRNFRQGGMKTCVLLLLSLATSISLYAKSLPLFGLDKEDRWSLMQNGGNPAGTHISTTEIAPDLEDHAIKVQLSFEENVEQVSNTAIFIFNNEYSSYFSAYEDDLDDDGSWTFHVPSGVYDIFVSYKLEYTDGNSRRVCISKSPVDVSADTETTISDTDATHLLSVKKSLPDGQPVILPKVTYLDEEPWVETDTTDATAMGFSGFQMLYNVEYGPLLGAFIMGTEEVEEYDGKFGIWVNEMSDQYVYTETFVIDGLNPSTYVINESTQMTAAILNDPDFKFENNYRDYIPMQLQPVHNLPSYYTIPEEARQQGWTVTPWINGVATGGIGVTVNPDSDFLYCLSSYEGNIPVQLAFNQTAVEDVFEIPWMGITTPYNLTSLPKILTEGEWKYINQNHQNTGCAIHDIPEGMEPIHSTGILKPQLPGHAQFSFLEKDCDIELGNSCPINYLTTYRESMGWNAEGTEELYGYFFNQHYIGRLGEARNMDILNPSFKAVYNGEILETDEPLGNWYYMFANDPDRIPGEVELTIINDNVTVDDMVGKNVTILSYDERNEEINLPSLTMLITKNTDGRITDRFSTGAQGIVEFSAGDFNYEGSWYVCDPIDVKVEYSPYGGAEYTALEVEQIDELFQMPNFGYFYRVALSQVDIPSASGWYTLRTTLTDLAGNSQTQVIEPAFYISDVTSVSQLDDDSANAILYSLDGISIGDFSALQKTNLPAGIYILRTTDKQGSTFKKIMIP